MHTDKPLTMEGKVTSLPPRSYSLLVYMPVMQTTMSLDPKKAFLIKMGNRKIKMLIGELIMSFRGTNKGRDFHFNF